MEESGDEASEVPEAAEQLQRLPGGQEFRSFLLTLNHIGLSTGRPVQLRKLSVLSESVGKSLVDLPPSRFGGIARSGGDEERCPEVLGYGPSLEPATVLGLSGRGRDEGSQRRREH